MKMCKKCYTIMENNTLKCPECGLMYFRYLGEGDNIPDDEEAKIQCQKSVELYEQEKIRRTTPHCPKCGSTSLTAAKKGFGVGKAIAGAVVTGGVGLLAGFIGSGKVELICLNCGTKFKPKG
ncbi:hypothetical protein [Caproiciproducens sp.]